MPRHKPLYEICTILVKIIKAVTIRSCIKYLVCYVKSFEQIITSGDGGHAGVGFSPLFVCSFIRTISQKSMQLGSPNLTHKCSTISLGNPFILRQKVKGQRHESQNQCRRGLCTLVSAGFI